MVVSGLPTIQMLFRSIIFAAAVQALFQISLHQIWKKNNQNDFWLMLWLFLLSLQLFFYYDSLGSSPLLNGYFGIVGFSIPLLSAPIMYHYIVQLSIGGKINSCRLAFYIVPWLVYLLLALSLKYFNPADIFMQFGYPHFSTQVSSLVIYFFTIPMAIVPGVYAVMGVAVLMDYQKNLPNHYSYTETINLDWLKWLTITIPVLFILLFSLIRLGSWEWVAANEMFLYVGAVLAIWGFLIGYFSLRQRMLLLSAADSKIEDKNKDSYLDVPYKKSGLDAVRVENIFLALLSHMDSRQAFLREDLSLSQLAEELAVNPNQLSQAINQHSGGNFFSFVNAYRVEEVKKKLLDPAFSHLSILGIALDSGFRSKSAFNRIFKQQVGMGPSEYQKMYR